MLKLSQNVAGVTFLALGNGSPDIFSCIAALSSGNLETTFLAFGAMFGAGLFVNTVVIGAVTISQDGYDLARRPFFRDCIFYLAAIYWTWYNCYKKSLDLYTGIGYIVLYAAYVALVIMGRFVFQRYIKTPLVVSVDPGTVVDETYAENTRSLTRDNRESLPIVDSDEEAPAHGAQPGQGGRDLEDFVMNNDEWAEVPGVKKAAFTRALAVAQTLPHMIAAPAPRAGTIQKTPDDDQDTPLLRHDVSFSSPLQRHNSLYDYPSYTAGATKQMLRNLAHGLNPLHLEDWEDFSLKDKIIDVISVPANAIFKISIPVMDLTAPLLGWNKALSSLQLLTCPVVASLLLQLAGSTVGGVPVPGIAACVGLLLMVLVLMTSAQGETPRYYKSLYTLIGFLMSIVWIYTIANEIVSLLAAFGHMFLINGAILGLTVLSWANSVGDLVSDVAMAKQGYPQMAVSACIGGPCLNMLLGIGLASTLSIIQSGGKPLTLKLSGSLIISSAFLMATICSHLVAVPLMNFKVKRWYGFYVFGLYACFLLVALLNITGVFEINVS